MVEKRRVCGNCYWWHHDYGYIGTCIMDYVSSSVGTYPGCQWHEFENERPRSQSTVVIVPVDDKDDHEGNASA